MTTIGQVITSLCLASAFGILGVVANQFGQAHWAGLMVLLYCVSIVWWLVSTITLIIHES